jgi:hypothetical protein
VRRCSRNATAVPLTLCTTVVWIAPHLLGESSAQIQLGRPGPTAVSRAFPAPASRAHERQRRSNLRPYANSYEPCAAGGNEIGNG